MNKVALACQSNKDGFRFSTLNSRSLGSGIVPEPKLFGTDDKHQGRDMLRHVVETARENQVSDMNKMSVYIVHSGEVKPEEGKTYASSGKNIYHPNFADGIGSEAKYQEIIDKQVQGTNFEGAIKAKVINNTNAGAIVAAAQNNAKDGDDVVSLVARTGYGLAAGKNWNTKTNTFESMTNEEIGNQRITLSRVRKFTDFLDKFAKLIPQTRDAEVWTLGKETWGSLLAPKHGKVFQGPQAVIDHILKLLTGTQSITGAHPIPLEETVNLLNEATESDLELADLDDGETLLSEYKLARDKRVDDFSNAHDPIISFETFLEMANQNKDKLAIAIKKFLAKLLALPVKITEGINPNIVAVSGDAAKAILDTDATKRAFVSLLDSTKGNTVEAKDVDPNKVRVLGSLKLGGAEELARLHEPTNVQ